VNKAVQSIWYLFLLNVIAMFFDEAASALDSESEKIIQQALPRSCRRSSHEEFLKGRYFSLWQRQVYNQ